MEKDLKKDFKKEVAGTQKDAKEDPFIATSNTTQAMVSSSIDITFKVGLYH